MRSIGLAFAACAALFLGTSRVDAAIYSSEAAFNGANTGLTVVDFVGITDDIKLIGPRFVHGGLVFTGIDVTAIGPYFWATTPSLISDRYRGNLSAWTTATQAVGFYLAGSSDGDEPMDISFYNGRSLLYSTTIVPGGVFYKKNTFFGIDGIGLITRFELNSASSNRGFPLLGPVSYYSSSGFPPGIPEPASWGMFIGGFGLLGGTLRRAGRRQFATKIVR